MTSFDDRRRERLHLQHCEAAANLTYLFPIGDDLFAVEQRGEISLVDGATLKSLLKQLAGKDVLP